MQSYVRQINLRKSCERSVDADKLKRQIADIIERIHGSNRRERGWRAKLKADLSRPLEENGILRYSALIIVSCEPKRPRSKDVIDAEFEKILKFVKLKGKRGNWIIQDVDGVQTEEAIAGVGQPVIDTPVQYVEVKLPPNPKDFFTHIYERDDQIKVVLSALQAGIDSGWENRFHTVLWGKPACGKTEILLALRKMVGDEAVLMFDATNTTQAGAIKELTDNRSVLPRIMIVEEIEKADENSLRWLLSVLDQRAEVRKVTYRRSIQRDTHMLTFATVNNHGLFERVMSGALASRFAHHLYCPRPDEKILTKILEREIAKLPSGDRRWIAPTIEYAMAHDIRDPRKVKAICLCGNKDLLNGKYQEVLERLNKSQDKDMPPETTGQKQPTA